MNDMQAEHEAMNIDTIRTLCNSGSLRWTNHVLMRLIQRNISMDDVVCAIMNGEMIEQYPQDYPHPSCLVLGITVADKYLHVVCGIDDIELWLITAYYPNPNEWTEDYKTRKENQ